MPKHFGYLCVFQDGLYSALLDSYCTSFSALDSFHPGRTHGVWAMCTGPERR